MKYKAILKIEVEFECKDKDNLNIMLWDKLNKPFSDAIFGNKGEEWNFVTLTNANGKVIDLPRKPTR